MSKKEGRGLVLIEMVYYVKIPLGRSQNLIHSTFFPLSMDENRKQKTTSNPFLFFHYHWAKFIAMTIPSTDGVIKNKPDHI